MAAKERIVYALECTESKQRNYYYSRGRRKEYKVQVKKYCPALKRHTLHKEIKLSS